MDDSTPRAGGSQAPASPLKKKRGALLWWGYLANYVLLAGAALIIVMEIIDSGVWRRLGVPLLFIGMAIGNLARMQAMERRRAEQGAAVDRGHM